MRFSEWFSFSLYSHSFPQECFCLKNYLSVYLSNARSRINSFYLDSYPDSNAVGGTRDFYISYQNGFYTYLKILAVDL